MVQTRPAIRVVGYLRRSTNNQDRSLSDQQSAIEAFALANGWTVVRYYIDDAISGTSAEHRPSFQEMVEDACRTPRSFDGIVVYDITRFGRMDCDETGHYRHILRMHGVFVAYASEGFTGGTADDLIRVVKQWQARQESKDLARITIRGQLSKFRSRGGGWWMSGVAPLGYDRRYEDVDKRFLFIVRNRSDGTKLLMDEKGGTMRALKLAERLPISDRDRCRLVPGCPEHVNLVRRVYYECTETGLGCTAIAARLNQEGIPTPRNAMWSRRNHRGRWTYSTIRVMLINPVYAGDVVWNRSTGGTFYRIADGSAKERPPHEAATNRYNDEKDWLVVRDAHPALVTREVFERAKQMIAKRAAAHGRFSPDYHRSESDFRAQFVLTGLLTCAGCSRSCWGFSASRAYTYRRARPYRARVYGCSNFKQRVRENCQQPMIRKRILEGAVVNRVIAWFGRNQTATRRDQMLQACREHCRQIVRATTDAERSIESDARSLLERTQAFLADLPGHLKSQDGQIRRIAFRRCIDRIVLDSQHCRATIWIRRLPVVGGDVNAGGLARVVATLPRSFWMTGLSKRKRRRDAQPVYDWSWHTARRSPAACRLACELRRIIPSLNPELAEQIHQRYVAYSGQRHAVCMKVKRDYVLLYLKLDPTTIAERPTFMRDVTGIGTQATGNVELTIRREHDLTEARSLIASACRSAGALVKWSKAKNAPTDIVRERNNHRKRPLDSCC